jgi:hypothetical protein
MTSIAQANLNRLVAQIVLETAFVELVQERPGDDAERAQL